MTPSFRPVIFCLMNCTVLYCTLLYPTDNNTATSPRTTTSTDAGGEYPFHLVQVLIQERADIIFSSAQGAVDATADEGSSAVTVDGWLRGHKDAGDNVTEPFLNR